MRHVTKMMVRQTFPGDIAAPAADSIPTQLHIEVEQSFFFEAEKSTNPYFAS